MKTKNPRSFKKIIFVVLLMVAFSAVLFGCDLFATEYSVSFETNGGNTIYSESYSEGEKVYRPQDKMEKDGHDFAGWFYDKEFTDEVVFPFIMPANDVKLYAKWTEKDLSLTFETNGGSNVDTIFEPRGTIVYQPEDPTKSGYRFDGWFSNQGLTKKVSFPITLGSNTVLYAGWVKTYNATFETFDQLTTFVITLDENNEVDKPDDPEMPGGVFGGWYTDANFENEASFPLLLDKDVTVYAKWVYECYIEFITYSDSHITQLSTQDGETILPDENGKFIVLEGTVILAPSNPINGDYRFMYWQIGAVKQEFPYTVLGDAQFFARWIITYTIDFYGENDQQILSEMLDIGTIIEMPSSISKTGYEQQWYSDSERTTLVTFPFELSDYTRLYLTWVAKEYTITYNYAGATGNNEDATYKVHYNTFIYSLVVPVKTGYDFGGWYSGENGTGTKYTDQKGVNIRPWDRDENITLYARWTAKSYTITFDTQGGEMLDDASLIKSVVFEGTVGWLPTAKKEGGNTFGGWFTDVGGKGIQFSTDTIYNTDEDITLYAKWTTRINYNYEKATGDNSVRYSEVVYNAEAPVLPTPTRANYEFKGWFYAVGGQGGEIGEGIVFDKHMGTQVYAKWETTIYFNYNDAEGGITATEKKVVYNAEIGALPTPTKHGVTLYSWIDEQSKDYISTTIFTLDGENTFTPKWAVAFEFNYEDATAGYEVPFKVVSLGVAVGELPTPTKDGYEFKGWWTQKGGQGTKYTELSLGTSESVSLFAKWVTTVSLNYLNATSNNSTSSIDVVYNMPILAPLPIPEKTGNVFLGWYTAFGDEGILVENQDYIFGTELFARWQTVINFDYQGADDGIETLSIEVIYGGKIGALPIPTKANNIFDGWFTQVGGLGEQYLENDIYSLNTPTVLYAKWINTISFEYEDATANYEITQIEVVYQKAIGDMPQPTKTGYVFAGWYTQEIGGGSLYTNADLFDSKEPLTLYAKWVMDIILDEQPGQINVLQVIYKTEIGSLPTPVKSGNTFLGWFSAVGGQGEKYFSDTVLTSDTQIILYAKWQTTITFDYQGGFVEIDSMDVIYNRAIGFINELPSFTYLLNFEFVGWRTGPNGTGIVVDNNTVFLFDTPITLYAEWGTKINFNYQGGTGSVAVKNIALNGEVGELPSGSMTGYTLQGWYTAPNGQGSLYTASTIHNDNEITLYAYWTANVYVVTYYISDTVYATQNITFDTNFAIVVDNPSMPGWTFSGWKIEQIDANKRYFKNDIITVYKIEGNLTVVVTRTANAIKASANPPSYTNGKQGDSEKPVTITVSEGSGKYIIVSCTLPSLTKYGSSNDPTNRVFIANTVIHIDKVLNNLNSASGNMTVRIRDVNTLAETTVSVYISWADENCVAEGTLITLFDGSQVAVEQLKGDELLLVWNLFTGTFEAAPILFIDSDSVAEYEITHLYFSDGTEVKVIYEHGFWNYNLNKYVYLRNDAAKYLGHWFNKMETDDNGEPSYTWVQLTQVEVYTEYTTAWSPVTFSYLCYYVNGMLSMPGATEYLTNIFEVDRDTMRYDEESLSRDIELYGLFTYEEFSEIMPVPEIVFEAFNAKYFKVAIGKGLLDFEKLQALFETYADFFNDTPPS